MSVDELRVAHGRATDPRLATELVVDATSERDEVDADPFDHSGDDAFGLVEQRAQQVRGRDLGVPRLPARAPAPRRAPPGSCG